MPIPAEIKTLDLSYLDKIMLIENSSHSHPWSENTTKSCFGGRYHVLGLFYNTCSNDSSDDDINQAAEETLLAYCFIEAICGEATIMNIVVDPTLQGKGYGKFLLSQAITWCQQNNNNTLWLEVRESNTKAIALYDSLDFCEVSRRHNYYPTDKGNEDAIVMSLMLF